MRVLKIKNPRTKAGIFSEHNALLDLPHSDYLSASVVVLITAAATLYGSALEAGRRSSRRPFQPSSMVPTGMRMDAPRSDTP